MASCIGSPQSLFLESTEQWAYPYFNWELLFYRSIYWIVLCVIGQTNMNEKSADMEPLQNDVRC